MISPKKLLERRAPVGLFGLLQSLISCLSYRKVILIQVLDNDHLGGRSNQILQLRNV